MSNTTLKSPNPWRTSSAKTVYKAGQLKKHESKWAYLFISPFFLLFMVFGLAPVIFSTYIAFFEWDPLGDTRFIGFDNFTYLLEDGRFWQATGNTFSIWAWSTFPQMALALFLASILRNPKLRAPIFWRTLLLIPNITSVLAVAIVFGQLFGRDFGMFNVLIGFLGFEHVDFVSNGPAGHIAIAVMITWRWVGYNALIFLAAMLAIPNELYESAELDGATRWQQFRYVTLPGLRNTITFVIIVGTIGGLQVFAEPLTLSGNFNGGDSRQFSTLTLFLFEEMFVEQKYGYAAAIGIAITVIVLIISLINFLITRRIASEDAK